MRKILIVSDTHTDTNSVISLMDELGDIDAIIHAGDHARDGEALEMIYTSIPVHYVAGNCDMMTFAPYEKLVDIFGKRFLIVHGHNHNVKMQANPEHGALGAYGLSKCADVVVFGHTHIPYIGYRGDMIVVNPGSLKYSSTYAICEIEGDDVKISTMEK